MTRPDFVFLTAAYEVRWSSIRFYAEMMARIKRVVDAHGYTSRVVPSLAGLAPGPVVLVDPAAILAIASASGIDALLRHRFVFIIGETIDRERSTFLGWALAPYLKDMTFEPHGRLRQIVERAWRVTWQNNAVRDKLSALGRSDASFFPIDGFDETLIVPQVSTLDVDILFYGTMAYPRRAEMARQLLQAGILSDRRTVIAANVFAVDELLARSRLILHVNTADDLVQVPYAKLMRPLANNKQVFAESTSELEASDLRRFVETFEISAPAELFARLRDALKSFDARQQALDSASPRDWIAERYNFTRNVVELLAL